jgi:hypothetical protein
MNKKLTSLMFVVVVAGCHSPSEGAVCPAPEEEAAEPEAIAEDEAPADQQKIPQAEIERMKRRDRHRFLPSR